MDVQGLLVVVVRCLEGTEEVTNPSDVEYAVDDVHHSSDGVVDVYLVHDVLLSLDVGLLLDVLMSILMSLLGLDELQNSWMSCQSPIPDDCLDPLGQQDVLYLLYDDISVDDVCTG